MGVHQVKGQAARIGFKQRFDVSSMVAQFHQRATTFCFVRVVMVFFLVCMVRMLVVVLVFFMLRMFFVLIFHGLGGGGGLRAGAEESEQGKGGNAVTQDQ